MKLFEWSDDLATGMQLIDEQHREVARRVNSFLQECMENEPDREGLIKTFDYLRLYTIEHFGLEEGLMRDHGYHGLAKHQGYHARFRAWVDKTAGGLRTVKLDSRFMLAINYQLVDHLQAHYREVDAKMGRFFVQLEGTSTDPVLLRFLKGIIGKKP